MRNTDQVITILSRALYGIRGRRPIVESQKGHMMSLLEFAQHEIRADLPAGIDRMQQVGLEPEHSHRRPGDRDLKFPIGFQAAYCMFLVDGLRRAQTFQVSGRLPVEGPRGPLQTFDPLPFVFWRRGSVPAPLAPIVRRDPPIFRQRWEAPCPRAADRPARFPPKVEGRWDAG